jgi:hypothetical protein
MVACPNAGVPHTGGVRGIALPRVLALPQGWRSFISELVSGALVAPFIAAVVSLVYYRLTAAHGERAEPAQPGAGYGPYEGGGFPS